MLSCSVSFMNRVSVPSTIIASPCFICFAFNAYGPEDWLLARSIAFSLWDLFFIPHYLPSTRDYEASTDLSRIRESELEMRPHLVKLNSTITAEAQLLFNAILVLELILLLIFVIGGPLLCMSVWRIGSIHRNFRCQICLAVTMYFICIGTRLVLIYYQLYDIPLTDNDPLLLMAELLRDTSVGYHSGLACAMVLQTLVATHYWEWYEKGSCSTSFVLLFSETTNILFAAVNASSWLLETLGISVRNMWLIILANNKFQLFVYTYRKNDRQLKMMTLDRISYGNYRIDRSFQVRENVLYMKYIVHTIVPAALIATPCFLCFAFNEFGPTDWLLSRSISYAVWDLFFAIFRVIYLYLEIRTHPQIWHQFKKLRVVRRLPKRRKVRARI
ncbi:hypothetical protein PMAYCL1PPCAC_01857 [Pristionchus mayeri]|uniref:G protein-coupled receptor n=1 Tax=Pristionchus mayeri TaxID=1317129 RepID=A0AAN4Z5F9_9BILA|nr:hypothetical protein PMAYCL1PPCAC_01857 [Pristionchus mayeri]